LVSTRHGASTLGCLFTLLVFGVAIYFAANIGAVYWHAYEFEDDMRAQVKYSAHAENATILGHLRANADSLGLPDDAHKIAIKRTPTSIAIEAYYDEHVELPMFSRDFHFHPHAESTP
jgi:hypothetical protein